jgi:hypothetical protein
MALFLLIAVAVPLSVADDDAVAVIQHRAKMLVDGNEWTEIVNANKCWTNTDDWVYHDHHDGVANLASAALCQQDCVNTIDCNYIMYDARPGTVGDCYKLRTMCTQPTYVGNSQVFSLLREVVEVTGDPHMRNVNGELFDLSQEGEHLLIQIPAGSGEELEVRGTVTAFHKERKCPKFFMTQLEMKGSMVGEESLRIVTEPENFGVKLGSATEFLKIDSTSSMKAGVAKVQVCSEGNLLCKSTRSARRTPNYANKILVQLSSVAVVASNYASANPSFMNLAVLGLAGQKEVGGLLGNDDHSTVGGNPECDTSSSVQRVSMMQVENAQVGHLTL